MDFLLKKPYEISLWEDKLILVTDNNEEHELGEEFSGKVLYQYYKEKKLMVIGSDTMDSPIKAFSPQLISDVNGTKTLTFKMFYRYYNEEENQFYNNPITGLLVNERKIKLRYGSEGAPDTKWYDFVVKDIQEDSQAEIFTYTAKDLYINELSKAGFNIELNPKLENSTGTILELGNTILQDSDWKIRKDFKIDLKQTLEEPLYALKLKSNITARDMVTDKEISIGSGKTIYAFYSCIMNQTPYFQFIYNKDGEYPTDENNVAITESNYYIDGQIYTNGQPDCASSMAIVEMRGRRLVRKNIIKYDPLLDRYVDLYQEIQTLKDVYGYQETEYISPTTVSNYVTNPNDFDSLVGWSEGSVKQGENFYYPLLKLETLPDIFNGAYSPETNYDSYIHFKLEKEGQSIINSGIQDSRNQIGDFAKGEKYILRAKYGVVNQSGTGLKETSNSLKGVIAFTNDGATYANEDILFSFVLSRGLGNQYSFDSSICSKSVSKSQLTTSRIGLFLTTKVGVDLYIEDLQFFPEVKKEDGKNFYVPDDPVTAEIRQKYYYYYPTKELTDKKDLKYIYKGDTPSSKFVLQYNDKSDDGSGGKFQKRRTVVASESNCFNLLQTLAETFECWTSFEIDHAPSGEIELEDIQDADGKTIGRRQRKWVSFFQAFERENPIGFKYGINLKGIKRNLQSDGIVSKLIVKNNANQYATDGFCSVARAQENPTGENAIYDFSYYINQGLLNPTEVSNDLYLETNGYLGYYKKLKRENTIRDQKIQELSKLVEAESKLQAQVQTYTISVDQAHEEKKSKEAEIQYITGFTFHQIMQEEPADQAEKIKEWKENDTIKSLCAAVARLDSVIKRHSSLRDTAKANLENNKSSQKALKQKLKEILETKITLNKQFYAKYSRFIQEGSWISENYIDDNLYYLDAKSTLHTSSQPRVSYSIDVLELSGVEGYENFIFDLGEKSYIEDTDFFGWSYIDGIKTPFREEIIVTQISTNLDDPSQNQIKVQNYRSQFEDLFQRITATTQSVEYSTGKYEKVATIIQPNGTISSDTLQNSLANNSLIIQNAKDQSVVWDDTGITTTSLSAPNEMLRIVSGGVFLSNDGGLNWSTGITSKGINANYITSGQIDTSIIRIMNGGFPSFRWDGSGISAYEFTTDSAGKPENFNFQNFIRFDQYGVYGIKGQANFDPNISDSGSDAKGEEKIWKNANFALTWKGFSLKSDHAGAGEGQKGYISISSNNDFQVINGKDQEIIKIGYLYNADVKENPGTEVPVYGISLKDENGDVVLQNDNRGKLYLSSYLRIGPDVSLEGLDKTKFGVIMTRNFQNHDIRKILSVKNSDNAVFPDPENLPSPETDKAFADLFDKEKEKIALYDDGTLIAKQLIADGMKAKNVNIEGTIYATGGRIGNLEISTIEERGYKVVITSDAGTTFKNSQGDKTLTATLFKEDKEVSASSVKLSYQWYKSGEKMEGKTSSTLYVKATDLNSATDSETYSCEITIESKKEQVG